MSLSDNRPTAGMYNDPLLKALALGAAASGPPMSGLDVFGFSRPAPQQAAMPPVLLQLIAQLSRDRVETDPSWKMIPGTNIPDTGVREDAPRRLGPRERYDVDRDIERLGTPDPNLDREMELPATRSMPVPLFLMRR